MARATREVDTLLGLPLRGTGCWFAIARFHFERTVRYYGISDSLLAAVRWTTQLAARQRPLPDAENFGGEVSF
jgi:hypothetical protein